MGKKENTCLMIKDEWGNRLPLYPFMEDILPGFMPGQPLLMQVTAVPSIVEAVPLGMNADDLGDGIGYAEEMPGQDHPPGQRALFLDRKEQSTYRERLQPWKNAALQFPMEPEDYRLFRHICW